jgi:hypothetical protein
VNLCGDTVKKKPFALLMLACIFCPLIMVNVQDSRADPSGGIEYGSGLTLYSPINATYPYDQLLLNLTFGDAMGVNCSLSYDIDGDINGSIPLDFSNSGSFHMFALANNIIPLPKLLNGSHCLTIYVVARIDNCHSANPLGAPFQLVDPQSGNWEARWVHIVYFSVEGNTDEQTSAQLPTETHTPTPTNQQTENATNPPTIQQQTKTELLPTEIILTTFAIAITGGITFLFVRRKMVKVQRFS